MKKKVLEECSALRSPGFQPDKHHISFCTNKLQAEKVHNVTSTSFAKTSDTNKSVHHDKVRDGKSFHIDKSSITTKTSHTVRRVLTMIFKICVHGIYDGQLCLCSVLFWLSIVTLKAIQRMLIS